LVYSIEAAQKTPPVNRIVVSTDDPEIAAVARQYGADVVQRPAELSGDTATSESALLHVLEFLHETESYEPDLVVFLQATSPLRRPDDIENAIAALLAEGGDSLFSASPVEGFVWRSTKDDLLPMTYDPTVRPRRQEIKERIWEENGSIYVFKPWVLRKYHSRLGGKIAIYPMDRLDSLQIDKPDDFALMERLMVLRPSRSVRPDFSRVRLLVLDFDGVMTDNRVLVDQDGREAVWCNRGDGLGITRLKKAGVEILALSTEANPVVAARCQKLGIECVQGCDDKLPALETIVQRRSLHPDEVAYVGNDMNDLACIRWVGVPIAVADAIPEVRSASRSVTTRAGGHGAVREVTEWLMAARR